MSKIVISKELQDFVKITPSVKTIYFDAKGNHYINVHKLPKDKTDNDPENHKLYGTGLFSHMELIPGVFNVDKKKEAIAKGDPETLIVAEMSREDILAAKPKITGDGIVAKIDEATDAEKALILEKLGMSPSLLEILNKLTPDMIEKLEALEG